ncbi:ribonuclease HII, degrades RNA of DNA-RNA hybrids [Thiomonas arsenitoxydans]|uniref:Ribonuclease HII n=1 Tax=Thiomonas arsenitoxydans (strain DSM 22701 / CIP 110005 / 3As) TaxID=426114 RepID=D6CUW6_THIA3|nr:ribonuclease HII [Thiomonas arsenitoxydans]CAZ89085.1 Ribonuclease HII (RNase HII) [Thiomonas arsenitoxydans]CQR36511.1 ribonuclease HII, degrades RNA of DNA-RNA hybrids [Thiomonas arsenitoxydans]CQR36549.1 ribonuclease HII, degrades RNA of DNA-RNA hybrids [Thiomonas arsenitoxydans]CQR37355.1 ribonuclease HII, degrades RNA of DNA-RNA hybrids [Thiomonas arsenitoxydans]CQR38862.1 ribonuclease HII, degrades RNA of DNA-RNA hybrids [Thiomonas arsenitoxydans]
MTQATLFAAEYGAPVALIAGCDEVGRGPWAGPVVAAAVVLDPAHPIAGLADSKLLSARRREELDAHIRAYSLAWSIAESSVEEIDQRNILQATLLAMQRAVAALPCKIDLLLVDGNQTPQVAMPCRAIVGGDAVQPAISAASIIAKVYRDRLMTELAQRYPGYGFERHSGYGTAAHRAALLTLGPCAVHRRSFAPIRRLLAQSIRPPTLKDVVS